MPSTDALLLALTLTRDQAVDQTRLLQQLLTKNAGKIVKLPVGTFNVRTLNVPKNTRLVIGATTILRGLPTDQPLPVLALQSGVRVDGTGTVHGNRTQRKRGTGVQVRLAENVTINGLRIREVAEQGLQVVASKKLTFSNMQVTGCGLKGVDQHQGINLVISQDIQVTGCRVEDAQHGIQWWGDETNGYCENLRIRSNRVRRVLGGGIWGNRGRNVSVTSNTVEICGDVGVDFEHSFNCTAVGNTVRDCKNYGLATFYGSERVTFTNNRVYQGVKYGHGIGLCGEGTSKQISFIGGSINTKGPNACGLLTVGTNVAQDILVQGVRIVTEGKGGIPIRVLDNNQFQIVNNPLISGANPAGVSLEGSSRSLVAGNTIVHRGPDLSPAGQRGGIFVYFRSADFPAQNNTIRRNTIRGYKTGINDECWGNTNSNNVFEQNITPNLLHRGSEGNWGGKALQNRTEAKLAAPVEIKQ
ncbi:right-handed parallel beta-helix repeat-containing protein [Spirosoma taeanense]|uniref:Right-handed parallel beta-helix repeat-containing protein n=1 Tax=Spirosoma taeanense TaxID=2735870 RepID=A0A6M5YDD1_9BACT|nr:right-handed parallel beta-helix repeat-containing protein [Spirosoma taeanense]QJW91310.1 right-handed parallel beta-helix repeat-containing protein [Spirosoma taeanense]